MEPGSSIRDTATEVLIIGAGPTGLVLALWLTRLGVRVRIIDSNAGPGTTSRALAVQARTLEFYRQLGFADQVVQQGRWAMRAHIWANGKEARQIDFGGAGAEVSPYGYPLIYPQDEHEVLLIARLAEVGVTVERHTEMLGFHQTDTEVLARIRTPEGAEETWTAGYLAGCDGARSIVRETLGIGFPGGTYEHLFYVADVEASGQSMDGDLHLAFDRSDFLVIFPLRGASGARFIGTVREAEHPEGKLSWDDVNTRLIESLCTEIRRVNWFSTYRVHHRVADVFRQGRAFLLGDAAHIHSPVGGQGMNTGIGDAVNLAWKLAAVVQGRARDSLLDSYEPERIRFARRLVATTDRAFTAVTSSGTLARLIRLRIAPVLIPLLFSFRAIRRLLFRTISQTAIQYRASDLSVGRVGKVHGGDRLPWVKMPWKDDAEDNFSPLTSLDWQVHVYGEPTPELRAVCTDRGLPLHVFSWHPQMARAGLQRNAFYLVRPDGYVALADANGSVAPVTSYLDKWGILPLHA